MSQRKGSTRQWRRLRAKILAASDVCHICGQAGADAVDHVIPFSVAPDRMYDPTNLRPAHHNVPPHCNRIKGDRDHAPMIIKRSGSLFRP